MTIYRLYSSAAQKTTTVPPAKTSVLKASPKKMGIPKPKVSSSETIRDVVRRNPAKAAGVAASAVGLTGERLPSLQVQGQ